MERIRILFLSVNLYIMSYQEYKSITEFHDQEMRVSVKSPQVDGGIVLKCCLVGSVEKLLS